MSCRALGMSISTYYYKPKDKQSDENEIVKREIEKIIEALPESGYRPVTTILNRNGLKINHKRTSRIMRENGLLCRKTRRYVPATTDSRHKYLKYPNIANDIVTDNINQVVVGDVTAYDINGKDHFFAQLMDRHNREVIGKAVSDKNDTALVLSALEDACSNREKSKTRARVEHVFGFIENSMNGSSIKTIGIERAKVNIGMMNLTYNLFRYVFLSRSKCGALVEA